ncbi:hypothetical protein ABZV58_16670 [Nocardia sp. NPDC004654]|uniref:hypothetical protein n=1 Tax=Nocardia sp. NPDC004654 TaxID=3154776 RepID=UPI0033A9C596
MKSVARRRGFLAELQHQHRLVQQRQAQQQRAAIRAHNMAVREAQRFAREQQRAAEAAMRASAAERAAADRAAKLAHIAAREAEAEEKNAQLAAAHDAIDNLLTATLEVDDWVDLESLREAAVDLPFDRPELLVPSPAPRYHVVPDRPIFVPLAPPTGLSGALGGNRRHAAQVEAAQRAYFDLLQQWQQALAHTCGLNAMLRAAWREQEAARQAELADARSRHEQAIADHRRQIAESNAHLDRLIAGLRERQPAAMDEYVGIVLANSIYPEAFEVSYEHSFDANDRELHITVLAPPPDAFPTAKAFRYNKANDEITESRLAAADVKRRYASAIAKTALRTTHEVFEADREEIIESISLAVAVDTVDRATGHDTRIDLVRLATDRADFLPVELARVEATDTLAHLAAAVSKNPYGLVPLANHGVRG